MSIPEHSESPQPLGLAVDGGVGRLEPEREEDRVRVLLEKAADALGLDRRFYVAGNGWWVWRDGEGGSYWNPLEDAHAALGLAVELGITVSRDEWDGVFYATATPPGTHQGYDEPHMDNPLLAACRAIVRCAAAMADSKTPNDRSNPAASGGPVD